MSTEYDPMKLLPAELWPSIMSHIEWLSIEQWYSWRTVSKQWYNASTRWLGKLAVRYAYKDEKARRFNLELIGANLRCFAFDGPIIPLITDPQEIVNFSEKVSVTGLDSLEKLEQLRLCNLGYLIDRSTLISSSAHWPLLRDLTLEGLEELDIPTLDLILRNTPLLARLSLHGVYTSNLLDPFASKSNFNDFELLPLELDALESVELADCPFSVVEWLPLQNVRSLKLCYDRATESAFFDILRSIACLESLEFNQSNLVRFNLQEQDAAVPPSPSLIFSEIPNYTFFPNLTRLIFDREPLREEDLPSLIDLAIIFQIPNLTALTTWDCAVMVPKPPTPEIDEPPPRPCLSLKEWKVSPQRRSSWTWGVLQLVPNLKKLTVLTSEPKRVIRNRYLLMELDQTAVQVINAGCLPHLSELVFEPSTNFEPSPNLPVEGCKLMLSHLKSVCIAHMHQSSAINIISSLNSAVLESLCLNHVDITPEKLLQAFLNKSSSVTASPSQRSPASSSTSMELFKANNVLKELEVIDCWQFGPTSLSAIANRFPSLTSLDISLVSSIWATHLRYLHPLVHLKHLKHVIKARPAHSISAFSFLKGFWPALKTFTIEDSIDLKLMAAVFGPVVRIQLAAILEDYPHYKVY